AYQTNRNLLLSSDARADSLPNLEIAANDVRCSHAATVGQLDQEELFYLRSRGIPEKEAIRLVILGFFGEVLVDRKSTRLNSSHALHAARPISRTSPTGASSSPATRGPTRSRTWRSPPTTCAARTRPPSGSWTRRSSSTCAAAGSPRRRRSGSSSSASSERCW